MKTPKTPIVRLLFLVMFAFSSIAHSFALGFDLDRELRYCSDKALAAAKTIEDANTMPRCIEAGETHWKAVSERDWTAGFWPGILWYAYEASGNKDIKVQAERFTAPVGVAAVEYPHNHDVGFKVFCSFGTAYKLVHYDIYKYIILASADQLAKLYNPRVGTINSWPLNKKFAPHNTIIDNMMNLELLFWASKNGGDQRLYDIACSHADVSMKTLIRDDYTTYHVALFDTIDGHFVQGKTHQGYADDSQWARGQTWGIYGYTMCYRETGNETYLNTAMKLADVFIGLLPEDRVPYWDFDDPTIPNAPRDASAAAIAASAMLELSTYVNEAARSKKYKTAAVQLLEALATDEYKSNDKNQAFLLHSTGHKPNNSEVDEPIIYADYYYIEALLRLKKLQDKN